MLKMQPGVWMLYGKDEATLDTVYQELYCSVGHEIMRLLSIQKVPVGWNEQVSHKAAWSA